MSDSLQPHGLQHTRLLCLPIHRSLLKFVFIELVMLSNHLIPFSFCLQSFPASKSFPIALCRCVLILELSKLPANTYKPHSPISALSVKKRWLRFLAALSFCLTFTWLRSWSWKRNIAYWALSSAHRGFLCTTDCILYTQQVLFNTQLMCNFISNISQGLANVHYRITGKKNLSSLEENPKGFNLLRLA